MLSAPVLPPAAHGAAPRPRRARRVLLVGAAALVLGACATNTGPKNFDDKALVENFSTSCKEANPATKDVPDNVKFCDCVYGKIRETYSFDEFKTLDKNLRDAFDDEKTAPKTAADLAKIDARYATLVDGCRTTGPSTPASSNSATTTTVAK